MGVIRYFSDPHFGHKNMAIDRGFADEIEMGEHIIKKWNSVVSKKDTTYILGDITMEKATQYYWLDKLNGIKKIVGGNHDKPNHTIKMLEHVNSFAGMMGVKDKTFGKIILTHCPIHPQELGSRFKYNMHGHVHENHILDEKGDIDTRYINVCAEVIDYTPKLLSELIKQS